MITYLLLWFIVMSCLVINPNLAYSEDHHIGVIPTFEGIRFESFNAGKREFVIYADKGYQGLKKVGFLRVGLIPTIELEDVVVEKKGRDGITHHYTLPNATLDWNSKKVYTASKATILRVGSKHNTLNK